MTTLFTLAILSACNTSLDDSPGSDTQSADMDTDSSWDVQADSDTINDSPGPRLDVPIAIRSTVVDGTDSALAGRLDAGDRFARTHVAVGDVDGDGFIDLAIGARSDDDGATDAGALYIAFLQADQAVREVQKVSALDGGLAAQLNSPLTQGAFFGYALAAPGDLDGDGTPDLIASAPPLGALFVLFLNADGTVRQAVQHDGLTDAWALDATTDWNNDGFVEIAAGNPNAQRGAGELNWLSVNGTGDMHVIGHIGADDIDLSANDSFGGRSIAPAGDINQDGWQDIVVGGFDADDGRGRMWSVFLDGHGNALSAVPIGMDLGGLPNVLDPGDNFAHNVVVLPFDDGPIVISGANRDDDTDEDAGSLYVITLTTDGEVATSDKWLQADVPGLSTPARGRWGRSLSLVESTDTDAVIAVGGGATTTGNVWFVQLTREP